MASQDFITTTGLNAYTVLALTSFDTVEAIGPGGSGSARQSSSIGGTGGGAGSYAKRSNLLLGTGDIVYYNIATASSGSDTWFNDLNLLLQTDNNIGGTSWTLESATATQSQTDPVGTSKATKHLETAVNALHGVFQSITKPASVAITITQEIEVQAIGRDITIFAFADGTHNGDANFNLTTGVYNTGTIAGTTDVEHSIVPGSAAGWWKIRFKLTFNDTVTSINVGLRPTLSGTTTNTYLGDITKGLYLYGWNATYGTKNKGFTPTTTLALYSVLAKGGTNGTTSAAGVGQSGSQGDTTAQGGGGFKPGAGVAIGGGGGGSGGPNGAGTTSTTSAGGAADNSTVTGGAQGAAGNSGTEFDGSHGCGSGGGGRSGNGGGFAGGPYGGGGSGTGTQAGQTGGAGGASLIVVTYSFNPYVNMPPMKPAGREI